MRHESLSQSESIDAVDAAAVWPASAQVAPLPIPETSNADSVAGPAPAAPDIPMAAGVMIVTAYVSLIAALAIATVAPGKSLLAIVISLFFVMMFFSVPAAFLGIDAKGAPGRTFSRFMSEGIETYTGHSGGGAALVQMLVVPVLLTLGVVAIGIAAAVIL